MPSDDVSDCTFTDAEFCCELVVAESIELPTTNLQDFVFRQQRIVMLRSFISATYRRFKGMDPVKNIFGARHQFEIFKTIVMLVSVLVIYLDTMLPSKESFCDESMQGSRFADSAPGKNHLEVSSGVWSRTKNMARSFLKTCYTALTADLVKAFKTLDCGPYFIIHRAQF